MSGTRITLEQKSFNAVVGVNVKFLRHKHKMSMRQVGEHLGVKWQQVHKYETGENQLNLFRATLYCRLFDIQLTELADPDLQPKYLALEECKALNNGYVKPKEFMNSLDFYKSVDEQLKRDDFLERLKGRS